MDSTDDRPIENESAIYRTTTHWAILLGPMFVIVVGWLALKSQGYHAMALIAFGVLWGAAALRSLRRSRFELTRNRLLIDSGSVFIRHYNIPLEKIASADFYQPSLGSLLNFGKIMIVTRAERSSRCIIRFVASPAELITKIREQMAAITPSPGNESPGQG